MQLGERGWLRSQLALWLRFQGDKKSDPFRFSPPGKRIFHPAAANVSKRDAAAAAAVVAVVAAAVLLRAAIDSAVVFS